VRDGKRKVSEYSAIDPFNLALAEELTRSIACQGFIAVAYTDQPGLQGEILRVLEDLVDATARLDRTGNGQIAVRLEP
jgi:hypothetical protein